MSDGGKMCRCSEYAPDCFFFHLRQAPQWKTRAKLRRALYLPEM